MRRSFVGLCLAGLSGLLMIAPPSVADDKDDAATLAPLLKTFVDELVEITPGKGKFPKSFMMVDEKDESGEYKEVTLKEKFSVAKYEVPQNLYEAVMGENPSKWKGKRNSVEMMTFDETVKFCVKLTKLLREHKLIANDEIIRLPTDAEWEYCCRAGTNTAYSFGNEARAKDDPKDPKAKDGIGSKASILDTYAWHTGNAAGNDPPVGAKKPNPWGLYDMHGYLWEFTADNWGVDYDKPVEEIGKGENDGTSTRRIIRGGSWKDRYPALRSSSRKSIERDERDDAVGIRCVKSKSKK